LQTSSRVIIASVKGVVDKDEVLKLMQKNVPLDAPVVRLISSNQSQEYFACATSTGFEII